MAEVVWTPDEDALARAVEWFRAHGYVRG